MPSLAEDRITYMPLYEVAHIPLGRLQGCPACSPGARGAPSPGVRVAFGGCCPQHGSTVQSANSNCNSQQNSLSLMHMIQWKLAQGKLEETFVSGWMEVGKERKREQQSMVTTRRCCDLWNTLSHIKPTFNPTDTNPEWPRSSRCPCSSWADVRCSAARPSCTSLSLSQGCVRHQSSHLVPHHTCSSLDQKHPESENSQGRKWGCISSLLQIPGPRT